MTIRHAMMSKNWQAVSEWLQLRHGVNVSADVIELSCLKPLERLGKKDSGWSDGTWDLWLRVRIDNLRAWPTIPWKESFEDLTPNDLHVFFPFLAETLEMLSRLPEGTPQLPEPARSKISKTIAVEITPIDAVAGRVT